jgi:hypothetical protein
MKYSGTHALLSRLLDQPNLVAAVQALPAPVLGKLIQHIGLEDCGEIVALATTEQLRGIFDDDLWRSERPGKDETFDARRFALWLEIMLEAGEAFAAHKLAELPEDLVTLALSRHILAINIEEMAIAMSDRHADDDGLTEKALESCLCEEIDVYRIISRNHEGWDAVLSILLALDRDHHEFLERVLEHCCAMAAEYIDDNGGLYQVLTSDEMLESDVGADREERRAEEGFIAPSSAVSFLALARTTKLADIIAAKERDPVTHAYFRSLRRPSSGKSARNDRPTPAAAEVHGGGDAADAASLVAMLRDGEVLSPSAPMLLLQEQPGASPARAGDVFVAAMRDLRSGAPDLHGQRMAELAYLANVLAAGCSLEGRALRPVEAARATVATSNLGMEYLLQAEATEAAQGTAVALLARNTVDKLFRIGWHLLTQQVVLPAARAFEQRLVREAKQATDHDRARRAEQVGRAFRAAIAAGKPWTVVAKVMDLDGDIDTATLATVAGLIDECPALRGKLAGQVPAGTTKQELQFFATDQQLQSAQTFLARL